MDAAGLAAALAADDAAARLTAAEALGKYLAEARRVAAALAQAAGDDDEQVSEAAAGALEEMGPPAADQCAPLAALLSSANGSTAYWAATLLGRLGSAAAAAAGPLAQAAASHADKAARERACWALGKLGVKDPAVLTALRGAASQAGRLARVAHEALGELGAM
jgi:HEAT repeat protein